MTCAFAVDSDSDGGTTAGFSESALNLVGMLVLWEGTRVASCKLCGAKSTDTCSVFTGERFANFCGRRPWLHYRICKDHEGYKAARGRICAACWSVFKQSGLLAEHNNLKKYMAWIKLEPVTRHAYFLKCLKVYEGKVQSGECTDFADGCTGPVGGSGGGGGGDIGASQRQRTHVRHSLAEQERLTSHEDTGFREKQEFDLVEDEIWKQENPGKPLPPTEMAWITDHETGLSLFVF